MTDPLFFNDVSYDFIETIQNKKHLQTAHMPQATTAAAVNYHLS